MGPFHRLLKGLLQPKVPTACSASWLASAKEQLDKDDHCIAGNEGHCSPTAGHAQPGSEHVPRLPKSQVNKRGRSPFK